MAVAKTETGRTSITGLYRSAELSFSKHELVSSHAMRLPASLCLKPGGIPSSPWCSKADIGASESHWVEGSEG
jgi:hypothetical protein